MDNYELINAVAELAESFDKEAKASEILRDRYDGDKELWTQYNATARAFRQAANWTWALVGS